MHSVSQAASPAAADAGRSIWNPAAAAGWSLVFTPAFGAYLLMRNWQALGEPRQAAIARLWFHVSLGVLGVQLLAAAINQRLNSDSNLMHWIGLLYLLAWCLAAAVPQARLLRSRFGGAGYPRKSWDLALTWAVLAGILYMIARACLGLLLVAAT